MTYCAGFSSHGMMSTRSPASSFETAWDAGAAHSDACPDRVDAGNVAANPDLRSRSGVTCAPHDLDEPLGNFRHFEREQPHHELRSSAAHEELRPPHLRTHVAQIASEPVAGARDLARDHFLANDDCLGVATQIEDDGASFETLHHAGHHFTDAVSIRIEDLRAFSLANLLHDDLLGGLRGDPSKLHRFDGIFDEVPDVELRPPHADLAVEHLAVRVEDAGSDRLFDAGGGIIVALALRRFGEKLLDRGIRLLLGEHHCRIIDDLPATEGLVVARLAIDAHPHVELVRVALASRARECSLDRLVDGLFRDPLSRPRPRRRCSGSLCPCHTLIPWVAVRRCSNVVTIAAPAWHRRSPPSRSDARSHAHRRGRPRLDIRTVCR